MNINSRRFCIHPGFIRSENDGEQHYISAAQLIRLYNLNPAKDKVVILNYYHDFNMFLPSEDDIHLYPQYRGKKYEELKKKYGLS